MNYTVRFCHLEFKPNWEPGQIIFRGEKIGKMGNTGKSSAAHLHVDCVRGSYEYVWSLSDMEDLVVIPAPKQLNLFIDNELFDHEILITSYYNDPNYLKLYGKTHLAYDVVPLNRRDTDDNYWIHWNRSMNGKVLSCGWDDGYGYYINIGYWV